VVGEPSPPLAEDADVSAVQFAEVAEAPVGAPEVPPVPITIEVTAPGVTEIAEKPETTPDESVVLPEINTSPAPPPPPRRPNPPPPPPPITSALTAVTPVGTVHVVEPTFLN
jgi:hypothetical protein